MSEENYRVAPPGFTRDQWEEFQEDGMLVVEDALTDEECDRLYRDDGCRSSPQ